MSGRKDYRYTLEQRRRDRLARQIRERRSQRARLTNQRLEQSKEKARQRAAAIGSQQRASNQLRMQEAAERTKQAIEVKVREAKRASQQAEEKKATADEQQAAAVRIQELERQRVREIEQQKEVDAEAEKQEQLQSEIEQQLQTVLQWQDSFAEDDDVQNFTAAELNTWQETTRKTIDALSHSLPSKETLNQLQQVTSQAEQMEEQAGEVADRFYARNEVMQDIIASLKEIGFFVQDPEYADANRPDGAVIIRASRGNQTMMTEVDLDKTVRSDWQGVHGEYCTDGFFEYVKAMNDRGVEITPNDPALKPRLLQKGAKDLPRQQDRTRGQS